MFSIRRMPPFSFGSANRSFDVLQKELVKPLLVTEVGTRQSLNLPSFDPKLADYKEKRERPR